MDDKWNPMAEDYSNRSFNSYNRGPASGLGVNGGSNRGPRKHKLFVRGLPKEMTNKGLENLFSSVATVTDCYVKQTDKPYHFGFVTVASVKEVENAIKKLDGHQIKDGIIHVSVAREENRDSGRPPFRPNAGGDARGPRGLVAQQSPTPSMNNGVMNGGERGFDENRETKRKQTQQTNPMSSMVTAGCEECQRLLMALMTHMQQAHSQGGSSPTKSSASPTLVNGEASLGEAVPYNGPGRAKTPETQQDQQQKDVPPSRGRSPMDREQPQSFPQQGPRGRSPMDRAPPQNLQQQSPKGKSPTDRMPPQNFQQNPRVSAFSKPNPKSPGRNKPTPVPMAKELDNQNNKAASTGVSPVKAEKKKAECDLKPCEACEKPGKKHCSKCHVTYCSVECQKGDWKKHKNKCKPNQSSSEQNDGATSTLELTSANLRYMEPSKKEMKALLTHCNNPGSFWIQVGSEENIQQYNEMKDLIFHHVEASGPLQDPKLGMACLARYAEDGSWYRVTIQTVGKDRTANVVMLDFGNEEKVAFGELRSASAEIMQYPVFALHCAIAGVEPRGTSGKWCYESTNLIHNLTKDSLMHTIRFEGKNAGIYQVVLKTEDGKSGLISIADALIKHELAWPKGSQPSASKKVLMMSSMKHMKIPVGGEPVKIAINNYVSPTDLQCQIITAENMTAIDKLSTALNACMESQPKQSNFTPQLGEVCAGRFTQDNQWYRVNVKSKAERGYFVEYVDFGNTEVLESSRMCPLPAQFHDTPQQSFKASFAGLPSSDISTDLSRATMQRLSQCNEGYFLAKFVEQKNNVIYMDVQDPDTKEDIAAAVGLKVMVKGHKVKDMTFRTIKLNTDTEFVITEAVSPGEFYGFSPTEQESSQILGSIAEGGNGVANQPQVPGFKPSSGDLCWAQFSCDKDWYRASVLKELPNDEYEVQYIDYGNGEKVHASVMRPMTDEMAAVPVLGIKCCIAGLPSFGGPWSSDVTESLKEMVGVGSKKILIRAIEHRDNVSFVKLEDPSTGLDISQEIINLVKESPISGPTSLSSLDHHHQQRQPSTPQHQPHSAPANVVSPEQLQAMEQQLALLSAQLAQAKGMST